MTKKQILYSLGSNPIINNGKLTLDLHKWFIPIKKEYPALEERFDRFELSRRDGKEDNEELDYIVSTWGPTSYAKQVRTSVESFLNSNFYIPELEVLRTL